MKKRLNPNQKAVLAKSFGLPSAAGVMQIAAKIAALRDIPAPTSNNAAHLLMMEWRTRPEIETPIPVDERDLFLAALDSK